MTEKFFIETVLEQLPHEPSTGQLTVLRALYSFVLQQQEQPVFVLKGYAGTGKTSLLSAFIKILPMLRCNAVLMAPTGRAAKVLASYTGKPAFTIHKCIYRQKSRSDMSKGFALNYNKFKNTIFIVDEASMISDTTQQQSLFGSGQLLNDLLQFVFDAPRCSLLLCGDDAQLPPVETEHSAALDIDFMKTLSNVLITARMDDVVRQAMNSGILSNANAVRSLIQAALPQCPRVETQGFTDVKRIDGSELVEAIEQCYSEFGMEETKIIVRSNKQAYRYNMGVRNRIMMHEEELVNGEMLMVVKNNYFWIASEEGAEFIANGDTIQIVRIGKRYSLYDCRFADASLRLSDVDNQEFDARLLLDAITSESAAMPADFNKRLFAAVEEDYMHIEPLSKRRESVMNDPFLNALQVKYAYAITCHKAQGGQWNAVFVDAGMVNANNCDIAMLRWLYTAFTRATKLLYLVNFADDFFMAE